MAGSGWGLTKCTILEVRMTFTFKLSKRLSLSYACSMLAAALLIFGCSSADLPTNSSGETSGGCIDGLGLRGSKASRIGRPERRSHHVRHLLAAAEEEHRLRAVVRRKGKSRSSV